MFELAGPQAEPSPSPRVTGPLALFTLLAFTLGFLVAILIVTGRNARPALMANADGDLAARPIPSEAKAATEVEIAPEIDARAQLTPPSVVARDRVAASRSERGVQASVAAPPPDPAAPTPVSFRKPIAPNPPDPSVEAVVQTKTESQAPVQITVEPAPSTASVTMTADTANQRAAIATPVVNQGAAFEPPQRIRRVWAQYPKVAQMAKVEGTVVIEAIIDEHGRVANPRIVKSIPLLNRAAVDAVTQWEFKPAMRAGRPVPVAVTLSVEFALP